MTDRQRHVFDDDISRLPVELARVHRIAEQINSRQEIGEVLGNLAKVAAEEAAANMSAIFLVNSDGVTMRLAGQLGLPEDLAAAWRELKLGNGLGPLAAIKSRVVVVEDFEKDPTSLANREEYRAAGIQAGWAVPLLGRDEEVIGAFAMYYAHRHRPSRRDIFMAQLYGFHASISIENAWLHEQLKAQAIRDGKTGLFNHDHFLERFRIELDRVLRQKGQLSLLMADIDDYKRYNDTYGHLMGDRALRIIGSVLRRLARSSDVAARYGGEEFALILPDTDAPGALVFAERLRREVEAEVFPGYEGELNTRLTVSVGTATSPHDGTEIDGLVVHADRGLYAAKRDGKNCVRWVEAPQSIGAGENV